jgi:hypothetical protein
MEMRLQPPESQLEEQNHPLAEKGEALECERYEKHQLMKKN